MLAIVVVIMPALERAPVSVPMLVTVAFFAGISVVAIDVVVATVRVDVVAAGVGMWAISCVCRLC